MVRVFHAIWCRSAEPPASQFPGVMKFEWDNAGSMRSGLRQERNQPRHVDACEKVVGDEIELADDGRFAAFHQRAVDAEIMEGVARLGARCAERR